MVFAMRISEIKQNILTIFRNWSLAKRIVFFALVFVVLLASFMLFKVEKTFSLINQKVFGKTFHFENDDVYEEENRINILMLGLRGDGDMEHGANLTDTMMVVSIKTDEGRASLFSIPRDLYVRIPGLNKMEKINYAYAYGMQTTGNGMEMSALTVQRVAGIPIDHVVVINFDAFLKLIDTIGGVDVYVPADFTESSQWGYTFHVPQGINHMDGETALYYSRSRYSSNDFDRARRQQDVLMALGTKAMSMGILANPIKFNAMLNTLSEGITTDIDFITMLNLSRYIKLIKKDAAVDRFVFDVSEKGLLVSGNANGAYILSPVEGMENFSAVKKKFRDAFYTAQ